MSSFTFFFYSKWLLQMEKLAFMRYSKWYTTGLPLSLPYVKEKACASSLLSEWGWDLRLNCPKPAISETQLCSCTTDMETRQEWDHQSFNRINYPLGKNTEDLCSRSLPSPPLPSWIPHNVTQDLILVYWKTQKKEHSGFELVTESPEGSIGSII